MASYLKMKPEELQQELAVLQQTYDAYVTKGLKLDMSRGKPAPEQLDLSMDLLKVTDYMGESGIDARNYGNLEGMPEARRFFAEMLGTKAEEIFVGGNSSLNMMYSLIDLGWRMGFPESFKPWKDEEKPKFICPAPGYDRHFRVTEYFGFELLTVPMTEQGPDMDLVESLAQDPTVKGIWVVPMYSNPDGYTCSDETVRRLASMKTASPDFKIFWDHAYGVHHLTDTPDSVLNILDECRKAGNENRALLFCSLSKVTFSGAGVAAMAASKVNLDYVLKNVFPMIISFDKMNQMRHVAFFKDMQGVAAHMKKHRALVQPKFNIVLNTFAAEILDAAHWTKPNGGYFVSLYVEPGCAKRTVQLCKAAGVVLTGAGAAYPYGVDPDDSNIRIAPTYPPRSELQVATDLLCVCVKIATIEKLLQAE